MQNIGFPNEGFQDISCFFIFVLFQQSFSEDCACLDISLDIVDTELGEKVNDGLESSIPGEKEKEIAEIFQCGSETAFQQCRERKHFGMISMRKLQHICTLHEALCCSATMTPPFHTTSMKKRNNSRKLAKPYNQDINLKQTRQQFFILHDFLFAEFHPFR